MPPEIGPLLTTGLEGSAQEVLDGLRDLGFVALEHRPRPQRLLDYLEPFMAPVPRGRVHLQPRLAARGLRAHQRPPPAQLRRRLQAQPAPGVPPHPPRLGWRHRGALPARRHGARTRDRRRAPPGGRPAARRAARGGLSGLTTSRGRASPRSTAGARGCSARTSTSCAEPLVPRLHVSRARASPRSGVRPQVAQTSGAAAPGSSRRSGST